MTAEARRYAPSALRNRDPILEVLRRSLPARGLVLEIASGTGEHVSHFASAMPDLDFQPSDPDREARASIDAWCAGIANVRSAVELDVVRQPWPITAADAILCINMIHIAPWSATPALMAGAARCLSSAAPLVLYGPYRRSGVHTAVSNAEFDASLRARNPEWGIRDLEAVTSCAADRGFGEPAIEQMPANNLCVIFRKR